MPLIASSQEHPDASTTTGPGSSRPTVLLADDVASLRVLIRTLLDLAGDFDVVAEAADGVEAVAMAQLHRPRVVIMDIAMPRMDGLQAARQIRDTCPDTKILVLSGFTHERMAADVAVSGVDAYLEKGTAPTEIVAAVRDLAAS